jgi:hypothetical protein
MGNRLFDNEKSELLAAVDEFADEMKKRLISKYKQGWRGWQSMGRLELKDRLLRNAANSAVKGDKLSLIDTANIAMMIHKHIP